MGTCKCDNLEQTLPDTNFVTNVTLIVSIVKIFDLESETRVTYMRLDHCTQTM
jgi:hypothetical protein